MSSVTREFDGLGQVTMETNQLNQTRSFLYDAVGNLVRKTDRNARVVKSTLDALDRLTTEQWYENATPAPSMTIATTTEGGPNSEIQRVGFTATSIFAGTYTLSFNGQTTSNIAWNATDVTVQTALEALSTVGTGNVLSGSR